MHTLNSLISALRSMADEKKSQTEILGWLYDYVTQYGIKMQYAEYNPTNNDDEPQVELIDGEYVPYNITTSETKTANKFVKFTYLESENKVVYKIILSYIREYNHGPVHQTLVNECNGAVIDALVWKLLVRPPMIFNQLTQSMTESVNIGLADDNYELIKIIDGTMVTIYNNEHPLYGSIWCISTANGYDVSFIRWMGPKTYAEIIYELLLTYPEYVEQTGLTLEHDKLCTGDTRLEFTNLDKSKCYSFIIRTHNFHPLHRDPEGIWTIDSLSNIATQVKYTIRDFKIKYSIKGNLTVDRIESIINNDKNIHYGYLLQSKKPVTGDVIDTCNLNVMIDSNLLKRVRDAIYKYPSSIIRDSLNHNNRTEYFVMKAFLTPINHTEFLELFPHYKPMFDVFQILFDNVVNTILQARQIQLMTDTPSTVDQEDQLPMIAVSGALLEYIIKSDPAFNPINADAKKIIKNYILKSEYAMMFLKLL